MIDKARTRILVVIVLLAGHLMLFSFFAQQPVNPNAGVLPTEDDFIGSPAHYLGDSVVTGGIVQATNPLVIEVETAQGTHRVTLTDSDISPNRGDKVRVYGILTEPQTIRVLYAFTVPQRGLWYTWTISFVAGLWVLLRLIRHWTVDISTLSFYPRESPAAIRNLIPSNIIRRGDRDA